MDPTLRKEIGSVNLRTATASDSETIWNFIKKLAEYEEQPDGVLITAKDLKIEGFESQPPYFQCILAEHVSNHESQSTVDVIGFALFYYNYTLYSGRGMYLEDFFIMPEYRRQGLGQMMFKKICQIGLENGCSKLFLECLNWNEPAQKFYEKNNGTNLSKSLGMCNFRISKEAMEKLTRSCSCIV